MITISHSQSSIADSFCYNVQSYLVVHSRQFLYTVQSHLVDHSRQFHLQYQVILGCLQQKNPFTLKSNTQVFCRLYTHFHRRQFFFFTLSSHISCSIHLHCQVILVQGCHIAKNPFTLSSHTWLSYCKQSIYTVK